jgi:alginate O-acetyltransferase complex protein AlgI
LLLGASLYFYAVGEGIFVAVLLGIWGWNYALGRLVAWQSPYPNARKLALSLGIAGNLLILFFFKYLLTFKQALKGYSTTINHLPAILANDYVFLGLSFLILQAIAYLVDIDRRIIKAERYGLELALYFCFFAKVSAGPITRYGEWDNSPSPQLPEFVAGIKRLVWGLGKVMILGSGVAPLAQGIFTIPGEGLTWGLAWMGAIAYGLWIYYNFSGYTDMAIGLGKLFALPLPENFSYPYTARSVMDFWGRWHRTLGLWFRDYLYVPLGGDCVAVGRRCWNWLIVGVMVGIWHGATANCLVWGLYYGVFLALETRYPKLLPNLPCWVQHSYLLLVVLVGWVIFRSPSLGETGLYLKAMVGLGRGDGVLYHLGLYCDPYILLMLGLGVLGCLPIIPRLRSGLCKLRKEGDRLGVMLLKIGEFIGLGVIFWVSVVLFPGNLYTYFLYSHF